MIFHIRTRQDVVAKDAMFAKHIFEIMVITQSKLCFVAANLSLNITCYIWLI